MAETVLEIKGLSKSFGSRRIIDCLSFSVDSGEVFGFLGPNGSGKTTTIKMIMGFLFSDAGSIRVCGHDLATEYEKAMANIGGIVENPEMYGTLTGRKNIEMYAKLHGVKDKARIDEVLELVGMSARAGEQVRRYSLGMKQRIGLAQALVHKPKLLILDEPTNGLDPSGIAELRTILKNVAHRDGAAVMVSSHILSEMQQMCDRVGIISSGKLLDVRSVDELSLSSGGVCRFSVGDSEKAVASLDETLASAVTARGEGFFEIKLEKEMIPEVTRILCASGTDIFGVAQTKSALEDAFLEITGGGMKIE